ncbi:hypothetical protein HK405_015379 [Cladochytrium tenue]|nr:hypothetical protein HK405_015379 [Cladochytrium tenue]
MGGGGGSGGRSPLSPGAGQATIFSAFGSSSGQPAAATAGNNERIVSATVLSSERREDGKYRHAVEVTLMSGGGGGGGGGWRRALVFRTHDDFWALQVSLLSFFPDEAGRGAAGMLPKPRRIPFMPSPTAERGGGGGGDQRALRARLDAYLRALLVEQRAERVADGPAVRKFLMPRGPGSGDVERLDDDDDRGGGYGGGGGGASSGVGAEALDDLIDGYGADEEREVTFRVTVAAGGSGGGGSGEFALGLPDSATFIDLLNAVEARLGSGRRVRTLAYRDEVGGLVALCGDEDLALLVKTGDEPVVLYAN